MSTFVGIDLGTTFSVAAHVGANGSPETIPNDLGEPTTPSVVWFGTDPPTVGKTAKVEQRAGAGDVASFFKRSMGDPHFVLSFRGRDYRPVDLSALVLGKLKADCEAHLGKPVGEAVITVPAYFNNAQREATIEAGRRAGLSVLRIINEPTAAALAYGLHQTGREETLLVYDLGGGTFDVTLVRIDPSRVEVLATDGDHELGGKDWDDRVAQFLGSRFRDEHGLDPLADLVAFNDLLVRCEDAKRALSRLTRVNVHLDHQGVRGTYELTRDKFEELTADLMARTEKLVDQVLVEAGLTWPALTGVLLVGGSTNMPVVHRYVERVSGKRPRVGVNVDEAVAQGAALQAAIDKKAAEGSSSYRLAGARKVQDVMSHSLGMIAVSPDRSKYINSIIIPKNKPVPADLCVPFKLRTRSRGENFCEVYVTQGESELPNQCSYLGKYRFANIAHDPSGAVILNIKYAYDHNGVVKVSAEDQRTGQPLVMTVEALPDDMTWVEGRPDDREKLAPDPVSVYLVIDVSGSMMGAPLAEAQRSAIAFRERCDLTHVSVGLVSFGSSARTRLEASQDARKIDKAVNGLSIEGSTNMAAGLEQARQHLEGAAGQRFIVLLTDGCPDSEPAALNEAGRCRDCQIDVIAVGTGGANVSFLKKVSSCDENAVFSGTGTLERTFSSIAEAITRGGGRLRLFGG
jgi:molecular chaperone DnaK (HSP70)/uncharacterized protein YegL